MKKHFTLRPAKSAPSLRLPLHLPVWRSKCVVFLLFIAFAVLTVRAFWIQGPGNAFYQKQGKSRYQRTLLLPATRGKIFDRNGRVLATSLPVRAIWAIPDAVPPELAAEKMTALAKLLGLRLPSLRAKLAESKNFVYLKRQIPVETAERVAALNIPGIYQRKEYRRFYPEGEITAHLLGFTNVEDEGQEGIELSMQKQLAGMPGSRRVIRDRMGHIVEEFAERIPPRDGENLTLSIDRRLQYAAYTGLKAAVKHHRAKAGTAIVLDAKSGEVLALVNYPTYNPNDRSRLTGEQLRNRALTDTFEAGSIMKPFTVARALDLKRVTPATLFDTAPGYYMLDHAKITDIRNHGTLTVADVIRKSSNIGMAKIALRLAPEEMWDMFTGVGFGQAPRIEFPGAVAGRLRPWQRWRRIEQATMAYGYGISASLVQVAQAYTVLANDGRLTPVTLFKKDTPPIAGPQIISSQTARQVRSMLETVVGAGGTGLAAHIPGYRIGGKTGTAYKYTHNGYDKSRYRTSFVGIAPLLTARVIVAVSIDEPSAGQHYGGQVAAPDVLNTAPDAAQAVTVADRLSPSDLPPTFFKEVTQ
jgi:cell division protein FtsI (penicillin-binding protein 3)